MDVSHRGQKNRKTLNEYPLNIMCGPEVKLRHIVNINRIPPGSVSFGVDTAPIKMPVYYIIRNNQKVTPPDIECHELRFKT